MSSAAKDLNGMLVSSGLGEDQARCVKARVGKSSLERLIASMN